MVKFFRNFETKTRKSFGIFLFIFIVFVCVFLNLFQLMTSTKSTSGRRASLLPPRFNGGSPNEPMVLASNVSISIIKHNRQRDQETEAPEKRNDQLNQQRHSLAQAIDVVNSWKQRDSINDSTNIQNNTDQQKPKNKSPSDIQNASPMKSQSTRSVTNYFYKRP